MMVLLPAILFSTIVIVTCRHANLDSGLAVIRDKVTPEEISEVILNPRKRDLSTLPSAQNEIEAGKIQTIINQREDKATNLQRDVRAVKMITTRLKTQPDEDMDISPDHFVNKNRLKRVVLTQANRKPKPFPAAFLTAVARIVVPARPESNTKTAPESLPRLLRLSDAKRST